MRKKSIQANLSPYLAVKNAKKAISFYKKVFGAIENYRLVHPESGVVCHSALVINGSPLMLAEEFPGHSQSPKTLGGTPVRLTFTVDNVDTATKRASKAGAKVTMKPADQFYGMRASCLQDPFGHEWMLLQRIENVKPAEMERRFKGMCKK